MTTTAPLTRTVCQLTGTIARTGHNPDKFFDALRAANDLLEAAAHDAETDHG